MFLHGRVSNSSSTDHRQYYDERPITYYSGIADRQTKEKEPIISKLHIQPSKSHHTGLYKERERENTSNFIMSLNHALQRIIAKAILPKFEYDLTRSILREINGASPMLETMLSPYCQSSTTSATPRLHGAFQSTSPIQNRSSFVSNSSYNSQSTTAYVSVRFPRKPVQYQSC